MMWWETSDGQFIYMHMHWGHFFMGRQSVKMYWVMWRWDLTTRLVVSFTLHRGACITVARLLWQHFFMVLLNICRSLYAVWNQLHISLLPSRRQKVAGSIPDGVIGIFHGHNLSVCTMALGLTQPLTEMSTRNISWGLRQLVWGADNHTTFMCWLSWNLGASTSWNPQGQSRPVQGLLYLCTLDFWTLYARMTLKNTT